MGRSGIAGVIAGLFCVLAGSLLAGFSLYLQKQIPANAASPPAVSSLAGPCLSSSAEPTTSVVASAVVGAVGSAPAPRGSSTAEDTQPSGDGSSTSFCFVRGDVVLPREELLRLLTVGGRLANYNNITITIEGVADEPGSDEKKTLLARRRATVVRSMLVEKGVHADQVHLSSVEAEQGSEHGGCVRVRVVPPVAEMVTP